MSVIMPERTTISTTPDRFEPTWIDPGRTPQARRDRSMGANLLLIVAEIRSAA